ncbi:hypothetical protein ACWGFX_18485 [Streptomyces xanthophaeus]
MSAGALAAATHVWAVLLARVFVLAVPALVLWHSPVSRLTSMPIPASTAPASTTLP